MHLPGSTLRGFIELEAAANFDHSPPGPDASWSRTLIALDTTLRGWPFLDKGLAHD